MNKAPRFSAAALKIDAAQTAVQIETAIKNIVVGRLHRRGAVLGLSGGIDSSVTAGLCVRALGQDRVIGLLLPEADSDPETLRLGQLIADALGIRTYVEDIRDILSAAGCYRRRDATIRSVLPEYGEGYRSKIVLTNPTPGAGYPVYSLLVRSPSGEEKKIRLTADACLGIVSSTNFKQRTRKMIEYYYADRFQLAVVGTPNRLEYDQGFFVKNGDGAADLKPIAHLYKSQVYQLAEYLGIPEEIRRRPPTTDTYSLPQSQEEFYFSLPLEKSDLCLYGKNHEIPPAEVAGVTGLTADQVKRVYAMFDAKRALTRYLHLKPILVEEVAEVSI